MQLVNIPRRHAEVGRIRLGDKSEKNAPRKLTKFRLTSAHADLLARVADVYGGTVAPWAGAPTGKGTQHELYVESETIDVIVPTGQILSQSYELWSGGGCQRRCNGVALETGEPCVCPEDPDERHALSQQGKACKLTTRLSMWLPRVPGIGVWRLESHGYYAAVELPGAAEILQAATEMGKPLPATLRIAARVAKRDGKTNQYIVPVLDLNVSVADMFALNAAEQEPVRAIETRRPSVEATVAPALPAAPTAPAPSAKAIELARRAGDVLGTPKADQIKAARNGRKVNPEAFDADPAWAAEVERILNAPELVTVAAAPADDLEAPF